MYSLDICRLKYLCKEKILHMKTIDKNCLNCQKMFPALIREINRGNGKFCSLQCSGIYNAKQRPKPEPNVSCAYCGISFYKSNSKQAISKSGLYFCCREHKDAAQRIGGIKAIMPPHYGETVKDYRTLAFKVAGKPRICERCGYDTHEAAIIVHHKDRNRDNNDISNLEVLCANCHAIEHWGE